MRNAVQLITYVDRLATDLPNLKRLLENELSGLFGGVHLLPYFTPYDGADAGFDPADHLTVDQRLGHWDSLRELAGLTYVISDLIVNHVSDASSQFQDVMRQGNKSEFWDLFLKRSDVFLDDTPAEDIEKVYRPRPGSPFTTITLDDGTSHDFWSTFSPQQLDINVECPAGQAYLESIIDVFAESGIQGIRLDAVGYAIKQRGTECFMLPETFEFIETLRRSAETRNMDVLVEIHSHYQTQIDIAGRVSWVYDFALPPLVLHTLFAADSTALKRWLAIAPRNCFTVLDTHDGIGIVDVARDGDRAGLLGDSQIEDLVDEIHRRSNDQSRLASGHAASNLDVYQVNTTFYDALGCDDGLYLLARAMQFFAPGVPQVYYVGLLAGENDMELLKETGTGRDINRRHYSTDELHAAMRKPVVASLLALIRMRNSASGFQGEFDMPDCSNDSLHMRWRNGGNWIDLLVDLGRGRGEITRCENGRTSRYEITDLFREIPGETEVARENGRRPEE